MASSSKIAKRKDIFQTFRRRLSIETLEHRRVLAVMIDVSAGVAAQSSQLGGFVPENALDDVANFTHTLAGDENPTWQVLLPDSYAFDSITVFNRGASEGTLSCCPSRLRDITIQIVQFDGEVTTDFTGGEVVASSDLLNPENEIGGGTNTDGPISLSSDPGGAVGNLIRVIRTPDDDLSGSGGQGNDDEGSVLSIDLVEATGDLAVVAAPAIDVSAGIAAQSSQLGGFVPENALDDVANFTHTLAGDENPTWQVLLPDSYAFDSITVFNRGASEGTLSCCPSRLRDITIQIVQFDGEVTTDFTGGEVVASSDLLNPENEIGGGTNTDGPISLSSDPGGAVGNLIRVIRTPDDDLSGSGGQGNDDEGSVLSIDLVMATGDLAEAPPLVGDVDGNGTVDFDDFVLLSNTFGTAADPPGSGADFDGDGNIDFDDFVLLANNFGAMSAAAIDRTVG